MRARCSLGSAVQRHPVAGSLRVRDPLSRTVLPTAALPQARPRRLLLAPRRRRGRRAARSAPRGAARRADPRHSPRPTLRLEPGDPRRPGRLPAPHRVAAAVRAAPGCRRGALRDALRRFRRRPPVPAISDPGDRQRPGDREPRPGGGAVPQGSARVRAAARSARLPARPSLCARAATLQRQERDDAPRGRRRPRQRLAPRHARSGLRGRGRPARPDRREGARCGTSRGAPVERRGGHGLGRREPGFPWRLPQPGARTLPVRAAHGLAAHRRAHARRRSR